MFWGKVYTGGDQTFPLSVSAGKLFPSTIWVHPEQWHPSRSTFHHQLAPYCLGMAVGITSDSGWGGAATEDPFFSVGYSEDLWPVAW